MIHLQDLVKPLGKDRFIADHLLGEQPFLADPNPALVETLRSYEAFKSPDALFSKLTKDVSLLGANAFRAKVSRGEARSFLHQGYVVYCKGLEQQIPEVRDITQELASELGAANLARGMSVEAFVSIDGAVSSTHFDHDINFQILLEGEKRWQVAPNTQMRNPLRAFQPSLQPDGDIIGFIDEVWARDPAIVPRMPDDTKTYIARAGSTMFLPRAWWHEVESVTPCFGVNFTITGITWATGLTQALCDLLHGEEDGREYCYGALSDDAAIRSISARRFETIRKRAIQMLQEITLEEVYLGGRATIFAWTPAARERSVVQTDDGWSLVAKGVSDEPLELDEVLAGLVKKLAALRNPFGWEHLVVLAQPEIRGPIGAVGLWNVLTDLVAAGYLETRPPPFSSGA